LFFPRKQGGRGLMQIEAAHVVEITKLVEYVDRREDPLVHVVRTHQHNIDSAVIKTARHLKTQVQREIRKIKGHHSGENKRKMAREEDARTVAM
jgi:hypothetical protein